MFFGLRGRNLALAGALYVVAAVARLTIWDAPIYGDEGHMFLTARTFGARIDNVFMMFTGMTNTLAPLFWYRPLSHVPLFPGAALSFDAWRLNHIFWTSFTAPLAFAILRSLGVRRWLATGAGLALAFNTILVAYGVLVFHDGLGVVGIGFALLAHVQERRRLAAVLWVLAAWVEEIAAFALAYVFLVDLWRGWMRGEAHLWPLRLRSDQWWYVVAGCLSPLMLWVSLQIGGVFPGHRGATGFLLMVDRLFYMLWLLPILVAGLWIPRARAMVGLAFVYPAFYIYWHLTDHSVQIWWMLTPAFLAVIGAAFAIECWIDHLRLSVRPRLALLPRVAAALVGLLVVAQIVLPADFDGKGEALMPLSQRAEWSFGEMVAYQEQRDRSLPDLVDRLNESLRERVVLIDVGWFFAYTPFSLISQEVWLGYTGAPQDDWALRQWVAHIDNATAPIVYKSQTPLNMALQEVYAHCLRYDNAEYLLIDPAACPDRFLAVRDAYQRHASAESGP